MAVSKQQQEQISLVPVALFISVVAAAAASYFFAPGVVVLWLGFIVAGFLAKPPQLTGPKDPSTMYPTVGNPGEAKKMASYRFWTRARTALMVPATPWPLTFSNVAALGAACLAYTLPTTAVHPQLVWANAAAAYLIVDGMTRVKREFAADDHDPMPATLVWPYLQSFGRDQKATRSVATTIIFGGGFGVIAWWWIDAADWYLIWPAAVAGAGVFLLAFAAVGHQVTKQTTRQAWQETLEAKQMWKSRFAAMAKLKDAPQLTSHTRVGENGEGHVDTFQVLEGSAAWIPMPETVRPTLPANTVISFMSTPEKDAEGGEITLSRSPREFKVISWRGEEVPDLTNPAIDRDVLAAWLQLMVTEACLRDSGPDFGLIPLGPPQALHTEDSETAAWLIDYGITSPGADLPASMGHLAGVIGRSLGVEVFPFGTSLAIGAVTADTTTHADPSFMEEIEAEAERASWEQKWKDMSPLQAPSYFPEHNGREEVHTTSTPSLTIEKRWFINPNGAEVADYMAKITTEKLRTGLGSKPWAAMTHIVRGGGRVPGGISVYWCDQHVPRNPAEIMPGKPQNRHERLAVRPSQMRASAPKVSEGAKWVLTGQINEGFIMSKLPVPEIISVQPLTSFDSGTHIWDVNLRLHGGATAADVKKAREKIRLTLGAEWLRVTESNEGARVVVGASPSHPRVKWRNDTAEEIAIRLDWEQAFMDSKVMNPGNQVPTLVSMETLPKNELVKKLTFHMPAGVSLSDVKAGRQKLIGATNNLFLDVRQGERAKEAIILAATESPMPNQASFDWAEVHQSHAIPFATGIEGEPVVFDPMVDPMLLFFGAPGSGKSATLQALLTPAAIRGWELHIMDCGKSAADFTYLFPYAASVATKVETVAENLKRIYDEVLRRKDLNAKYGTPRVSEIEGPDRPRHMIVVIDEFTSTIKPNALGRLADNATEEERREHALTEKINMGKRQIGMFVGKIMREARSAGVTMILAGQTLSADEMKASPDLGNIKNLAATALLGKASFGQRMSTFKNIELVPELGEAVPKGRGIFESAEGAPIIFQSWYDAPNHLESMLDQIESVRDPEPVTLRDGDLTPSSAEVTVFGERLTHGGEEVVVDLGELTMDLGELSFDDLELPEDDDGLDANVAVQDATPAAESWDGYAPAPAEEAVPESSGGFNIADLFSDEAEEEAAPEPVSDPQEPPAVRFDPAQLFSAPEPQTDPEPEVAAPDPQPQLPAVRFEAAQPKRNPRQIPIEF